MMRYAILRTAESSMLGTVLIVALRPEGAASSAAKKEQCPITQISTSRNYTADIGVSHINRGRC